jgi:hypothetical protein
MKYRTSPDRYSFHQNCDKKNLESGNMSQEVYETYQKFWENGKMKDSIPTTDLPDLEYELRTSDYIHSKCIASEQYCMDLYAALCNNDFIKDNKECSYTWRTSGGIIANILEKGDYINFYCGGNEGYVTDEVREDITKLGWEIRPIP